MSATVEGFLKGLRYIAQIFGLVDAKEQEMQIGFPTDVKHVAHIGWDGQSANAPSWMDGFKSVPELAHQTQNSVKESKNPTKDLAAEVTAGNQDTQPRKSTEKPKNRSRSKSSNGREVPLDSPSRRGSDGTKQSKRNRPLLDSPRAPHNSNLSIECQDPAGVSKPSRRKKSKGSERTSKPSKSRGQNPSGDTFPDAESKTDTGQGMTNKERELNSVLEGEEVYIFNHCKELSFDVEAAVCPRKSSKESLDLL